MEFGKLIPQVFFDILARVVPGAILVVSWIVLFGHDRWSQLLNVLLGGHLAHDNVVAAATLTILWFSFIAGHLTAPFGKLVQRLNEHSWFIPDQVALFISSKLVKKDDKAYTTQPVKKNDKARKRHTWIKEHTWLVKKDDEAGEMYDWLRAHHPDQGALCAKIRAEFTMYNALAVTFLAVAVMSALGNADSWVTAISLLAVPIMAHRGGKTEGTYQKTTKKFSRAYNYNTANIVSVMHFSSQTTRMDRR
jgi:hypothetical protein